MYKVTAKQCKEWIVSQGIDPVVCWIQGKGCKPPYLLEVKGVNSPFLTMKVEVVNVEELKEVLTTGQSRSNYQNIYWIRGKEWEVKDGIPQNTLQM